MSIDQYSTTPANNDLTNYFKTGMRPSSVKSAGWDIMADLASYLVSLPTAAGTSSAVTVTNGRAFGSLAAGLEQVLVPSVANAAAASFAPDGLSAKPIFNAGHAVVGGELQPSTPIKLKYDGTNWNIIGQAIGPPGLLSGALEATIFTASGTFTPKATANYLVVGIGGGGGGGGGGAGISNVGGNGGVGGSGGAIGFSIVSLTAGTGYAVVIGTGGTQGSAGITTGNGNGGSGSNGAATTFNGVTISPGGAGGNQGRGASSPTSSPLAAGTNGGGYGGGSGGFATAGIGPAGQSGAVNTGSGGGGGGGGGGSGNQGGIGGNGAAGILVVIRA
ncbi:MAG TPA: hypothetical protein VGM16_09190 [Gammaproteobacteria bacterium]